MTYPSVTCSGDHYNGEILNERGNGKVKIVDNLGQVNKYFFHCSYGFDIN